jgi:hypothetical protein
MGAEAGNTQTGAGQSLPDLSNLPQHLSSLQPLAGHIFTGVVLLLLLAGAYKVAPRIWKALEETLLSNWRLGLLAATALVLSLASGWTTWDGMRNFTNEPILSLMITFGIQGVMLIIAWLIGESFATGMSQQSTGAPRGTLSRGFQAGAGGLIGTLLFITVSVLFLQSTGQVDVRSASAGNVDFWGISDKLLVIVVGLLLAALIALYSASDIVKPYLQSSRVIVKNAVLWVMFLACMATSVFFSFDSLFTAIFPQSERVRAAELRAQNQVAGIVADIGSTIETRRITAADELFRSEGWTAYEQQLDALATASRGAEGQIEAYYVQKMEQGRAAIAEQQERAATAESGQAGLSVKKASLTEELSRIEAERPALATELAQKKSELEARAKEVDAKRVEAMAEDKGVEGTLKSGRGPVYRERMAELGKLQDYYKIGEQRVKDAQKRIDDVNAKIDNIKRQLAEIDGSLAKLAGEADTAKQRIAQTSANDADEAAPKIDPSRVLPAFETARAEFRQKPELPNLAKVQDQCAQLLTAMVSTPTTKERVGGIDCDPKRAMEAGAVLFALNAGAQAYLALCAGGDKLAVHTTADALFGFSRKCLADSGLPSQETDALRTKINFIELNRDDKAHRFVVTWNAFQDGNRLAYLALAIAIAIDSLIFMSGLFGANAVRSPLSDVPGYKARSAQQLEDIIENALLPDTFETARLTLQSLRPITNEAGFMAEVRPRRLDPHAADRVIAVLNAGATIHAVEYDPDDDRYLVRAELFEFLSIIAKKSFQANEHNADFAELEQVVTNALLPDAGANAEVALSYVHPISEKHGFMAEVKLGEVEEAHKRTVRHVLNAGATLQRVQRAGEVPDHYFIHRDLFKTLVRIRARALYVPQNQGRLIEASHAPRGTAFGGSLSESRTAIEHKPAPFEVSDAADDADRSPLVPPPSLPNRLEQARIREHLLMAMGFAPSAYGDLVREPGALAQANAAAEQLRRVCKQLRSLGVHIETDISELESDLDRAADGLKHETYSAGAVDQVRLEIRGMLQALMLVHGGRYQAILLSFINNLENQNGEGNLNARERILLRQLKLHESELSKLPRQRPEDWQKVSYALENFASNASDDVSAMRNQDTRRLN